jgi:hypothetical protein
MPSYLSPGVYVEEVEAGSRPIEGVGTAVAAFVGLAAQGPANTPTLVTNWSQFVQSFGDFIEGLVPGPRRLRLLPQRRRRGLHRPDRRRRQPAGRPPGPGRCRREGRHWWLRLTALDSGPGRQRHLGRGERAVAAR